jgi:uncharacterized membrane-anchored protein
VAMLISPGLLSRVVTSILPLLRPKQINRRFLMLAGYKTYIVAALAIIAAVGAYFTGDETAAQAIQLVITAILGATVRHGVSTTVAAVAGQ